MARCSLQSRPMSSKQNDKRGQHWLSCRPISVPPKQPAGLAIRFLATHSVQRQRAEVDAGHARAGDRAGLLPSVPALHYACPWDADRVGRRSRARAPRPPQRVALDGPSSAGPSSFPGQIFVGFPGRPEADSDPVDPPRSPPDRPFGTYRIIERRDGCAPEYAGNHTPCSRICWDLCAIRIAATDHPHQAGRWLRHNRHRIDR